MPCNKYATLVCSKKGFRLYVGVLKPETIKELLLAALDYKADGTEPDSKLLQDRDFYLIWMTMLPRLQDEHNTYLQKVANAKATNEKRKNNYANNAKRKKTTLCVEEQEQEQEQNKKKDRYRGKVIHISKIPDRCTKCGGLVVRSVGKPNVYKCIDCSTLWSTAPP